MKFPARTKMSEAVQKLEGNKIGNKKRGVR